MREVNSRAQAGRLAQSDRMASIGLLAAGVAHEINNPLTYVLYNLQGLAEDLPALTEALTRLKLTLGMEKARGVLRDVMKITNGDRLNDLVNQAQEATEGACRIRSFTCQRTASRSRLARSRHHGSSWCRYCAATLHRAGDHGGTGRNEAGLSSGSITGDWQPRSRPHSVSWMVENGFDSRA
jgi:hypothetical protein